MRIKGKGINGEKLALPKILAKIGQIIGHEKLTLAIIGQKTSSFYHENYA